MRGEHRLVVGNGLSEALLSRQRLGEQAMCIHIVRRPGQQRFVRLNRVRPISLRLERLPDGDARLPHEKARRLLKNERLELRDALVERPLAQERRAEVVARRRVSGAAWRRWTIASSSLDASTSSVPIMLWAIGVGHLSMTVSAIVMPDAYSRFLANVPSASRHRLR